VHLELPVLGLRGSAAFLQALARCPSLQRLTLKQAHTPAGLEVEPATMELLASTVSSLTQLRQLCIEWASMYPCVEGSSLAGLLRALPSSLEDMQLENVECKHSIPLSCMTHLVNLRAWDTPSVAMVELDSSSGGGGGSSSGGGGSSGSSSGGGGGSSSGGGCGSSSGSSRCAASTLTALTHLRLWHYLSSSDARLQLPNLRSLHLQEIDPGAWEQLRAMKQLRALTVVCSKCSTGAEDDHGVALGGMTQLQELQLTSWVDDGGDLQLPVSKLWAGAVADLTRLSVLHLPAHVLLVGGSDLLAPLTQLRELTVNCRGRLDQQYYPEGDWASSTIQDPAAIPAGPAVEAIAAAVRGGWAPLRRLVLLMPSPGEWWLYDEYWCEKAVRKALPGLMELVVQEAAEML
jgi:hypothetical protein